MYELHAWKNGTLGNYTHPTLQRVTAFQVTDVGDLHWQPIRYGPTLWEIGRPDHDSREFHGGYQSRWWDTYDRYTREFPNGTHYRVRAQQSRAEQIRQWARD